MSESISLSFGVISAPIETQLNSQGYTLGNNIEHFEKLKECINRLQMCLGISEQTYVILTQQLHDKIIKLMIAIH